MLIYLCHPLSGDVEGNLKKVDEWVRWFIDRFPGVVVFAPWTQFVRIFDDKNPNHRALGLLFDTIIVPRCDAAVVVGDGVTFGSGVERGVGLNAGIDVLDLTKRALEKWVEENWIREAENMWIETYQRGVEVHFAAWLDRRRAEIREKRSWRMGP